MAYTRTFNDFNGRWNEHVTSNGSSILSSIYTYAATGTRTGEKVIDWKKKVAAGLNAGSAYSLDRSKLVEWVMGDITSKSHSRTLPRENYVVRYTGAEVSCRPIKPVHLSTQISDVEATALAKLYKKIKQEQQHMNSLAIIAEFADVVRQFGAPAASLVDLTNRRLNRLELERRGLKGTIAFKKIKWAKIVASTYLEWSFGLAPLIDDTAKAAEAMARWQLESEGLHKLRKKVVSRASQVVTQLTAAPATINATSTKFVCDYRSKIETEARIQYTVGLKATPTADFGSNDRLIQLLGFDHANWVPAIWEAVPWSWLIDYFTNVQQILDAAVTSTSEVKWISKAVTYKTTREIYTSLNTGLTAKAYGPAFNDILDDLDSPNGQAHAGRSKVIRTTLTRTIPSSLGVPPLSLEIPVKPKQLANMVAVLFSRRATNSALWLI